MNERFGRETFQEAMKLTVRSHIETINWDKLKFQVFDVPTYPDVYQHRYQFLGTFFKDCEDSFFIDTISSEHILKNNQSKFIEVAPKEVCTGFEHMQQFLQNIIDEGGEGIILRDPLCPPQTGRSAGFLKHKVLFSFIISFSY
jgi:DNA ligase-1